MAILETTSKRNDEDRIELTVTVSASEAQSYVDAAYKVAGKVRIPGFRPGKAPRRVLENHYGGKEYFQAQATDELVKESLPRAIDTEGHVPLDKPEIAEFNLIEEGKDYSYTINFTVRPLFELSSYEPVRIELPGEEPTPEEIEQQVDIMLGYYIDYEDVTDKPVAESDFLTLEMEIVRDGERIEGLSGEAIPYQLGSGGMPASFDRQLIGMAIDETREFDFALTFEGVEPTDDDSSSSNNDNDNSSSNNNNNNDNDGSSNKSIHAVVTVRGIKAGIKPELTDAWVKEKIEFDSVDEFKNRIADSIRTRKQSELATLKEHLISEELASRLQGEPPSMLIAQTEQSVYRDFFTSLQRSGQTFDSFLANANTTPDVFREDIRKQAIEITAQALALDAFARHLALEITDDEVREEFESGGSDDAEELYQQWKDNGRLSEIREGLLRMKAARHLNENAEIFEPGTKPVEKKPAGKKASKAGKATADKTEATPADETAADVAAADVPAASKAKKPKSTEKKPADKKAATKTKPVLNETDTDGH
jgi:trigger factor